MLSSSYTPVEEPPSPALSSEGTNDATDIDHRALSPLVQNQHQPHPNCPSSLGCLPDTTGRPQHTLPIILRCAILGSAHQRLTIREIYGAMEDKYPYYRTAGQTWKVHLCLCCPTDRGETDDRLKYAAIRPAPLVAQPAL